MNTSEMDCVSSCDPDCDGVKRYTDGIFSYCLCQSRVMNTFVGADIRPKEEDKTCSE